jgi:hypothetical protein
MSKINNYDELLLEKKRLEYELLQHKAIVNSEIAVIKHRMEPITNIVSFLSPSSNPEQPKNKLLQAGTNLGIELLIRQKLLSKAGWFTKLVVPYILKKVSSKAIERAQEIRK